MWCIRSHPAYSVANDLQPQSNLGNDAFSNITHSLSNKSSVTIFDLVESHCLPNLYGMLALALHNLSIVEDVPKNDDGSERHDEEEKIGGPTHLSITLPCKRMKDSPTRYDISVSMNCYVCGVFITNVHKRAVLKLALTRTHASLFINVPTQKDNIHG